MNWLKVLNSPFKPFRVEFYIGRTAIGVPYFYPRKWVPNPEKPGYFKAVPIKIGFNYCGLGWKTKWSDTDYRHEYNPVLSFVFFGYQIALRVINPHFTYWEAWLCYERNTDKSKSKTERLLECMQMYPNKWKVIRNGKEVVTNHYSKILKTKYLKYIQ